jgi:class 3 adenylate cyclase
VAIVFFIYDMLVQRRNEKIIANAARSNAIVSSMFPDAIRDRLLQQNDTQSKHGQLKSFLMNKEGNASGTMLSKPMADLFLETTVLFADVSGFTAWSSVRDPSQVFTLLESVYNAFDVIATRRRVFKVETVGDCYVAVTGLPEAKKDHAVVMARFAREIMLIMTSVTRELELSLGPGTADLQLRIGIHSGPVTGGVLRGERSRFQLFGDTMNTTARIESTGVPGCIQLSSETAELLKQAGKQSWLKKRDECVIAKGKGSMQTYWLCSSHDSRDEESDRKSVSSGGYDNHVDTEELIIFNNQDGELVTASHQTSRLINWNVELHLKILREIVARRSISEVPCNCNVSPITCRVTNPIDEVQEIITLPEFDSTINYESVDATAVVIPAVVVAQLKMYITW